MCSSCISCNRMLKQQHKEANISNIFTVCYKPVFRFRRPWKNRKQTQSKAEEHHSLFLNEISRIGAKWYVIVIINNNKHCPRSASRAAANNLPPWRFEWLDWTQFLFYFVPAQPCFFRRRRSLFGRHIRLLPPEWFVRPVFLVSSTVVCICAVGPRILFVCVRLQL